MYTKFMDFVGAGLLFAQEAGAGDAAGKAQDGQSLLPTLVPFVAIFILFYFVLIRPQRREQARRQEMLAAIQKNDRVVTAGGIYGVVTNVDRDANEVTIKVDEATNTKLRLTLSSVSRLAGDESAKKE